MGKGVVKRSQVLLPLLVLPIMALCVVRVAYAQRIRLGADYLFEKRQKSEEEPEYSFYQTYDLILEKTLRPLYDLKFKFQFKSEQGAENRNRLQNLPSVFLHLGNQVVGLNSGFSKDNIRENDRNYDLQRGYTTFIWSPHYLPRFTLQYQDEKKDLDDTTGHETDKSLLLRDDYQLALGVFLFSHSLSVEKKKVEQQDVVGLQEYNNHDLYNRGQINYQFSALDSRFRLSSDYEVFHHDKKDKEANNVYRSIEQKANFRFYGLPKQNIATYYDLFLGETQKWPDHDRQTSVGNNFRAEILPHKYFKTIFDVSHDNRWQTKDDIHNSVLSYGLRLEPEIPGLLLDPNIPTPPLKTSLLLNTSLNKTNGRADYRTNSLLLKASTELYPGVEVRTDFELINTISYIERSKEWEKDIKLDASFKLRDDLKYYLRNENDWIKQHQEGAPEAVYTFDGELWNMITYRPADQFFLTLDSKLEYGDISRLSYSYRVGWTPAPKLHLEARYQSAEAGEDKYLSSEMNINITRTLKFRIKYTYPSEDQVISFRFTLRT